MPKKKGTLTIWVEEFSHAYLVHGTALVGEAREALALHLGGKRKRINRMPARPFHHESGHSCVAMYFNIGPACPCHKQTNKYKP